MLNVAEQAELPVGPLGVDEGLERPIQLLDRHLLFGVLVDGRTVRGQRQSTIPSILFFFSLVFITKLLENNTKCTKENPFCLQSLE